GVAGIAAIHVVIEPEAVAAVEAIVPQGLPPVRFVPSAANIADSVYAGAEGTDGPVVVTTADNVLLTGAAVARTAGRLAAGDDVVIAVAREADVRAAHPDGQRRFYKFADSGYSNCNLYGLSPAGLRTAEAFRG